MLSETVSWKKNPDVAKIVNGMMIEKFVIIWDYLEFLCEGKLRRMNPFTWKCCIQYADNLPDNSERYDLGFSNDDGEDFCVALAGSIKSFALLVDAIVRKSRMDDALIDRAQKIKNGRDNFIKTQKILDGVMELIDTHCILEGKRDKFFNSIVHIVGVAELEISV